MRRKMVTFFLLVGLFVGVCISVKKTNLPVDRGAEGSDGVVFFGNKNYQENFDQSIRGGKVFSDQFRAGLNSKKAGDYSIAIKLFNECLPHAALGPEIAMVYKQLAEIYRAQGDLEKEMGYLEKISKYTMSDRIKNESAIRVDEIRRILESRKTAAPK